MFRGTLLLLVFLQTLMVALSSHNLTDFMESRRKRSLVFEGAGSIQFSAAGVWPVSFDDGTDFKSLNCIAVLQSTFPLPTQPLRSPWLMREARSTFDRTKHHELDRWRQFIYRVIEKFMNKNGGQGRECMLRSICENAQVGGHTDVYSRILDVLLTPSLDRDDLDEVYHEAMQAGRFGVDCLKTYSLCPYGHSFFDQFIVVT